MRSGDSVRDLVGIWLGDAGGGGRIGAMGSTLLDFEDGIAGEDAFGGAGTGGNAASTSRIMISPPDSKSLCDGDANPTTISSGVGNETG